MKRNEMITLIGKHMSDYVNADQVDTLSIKDLEEIIIELKDWGKLQPTKTREIVEPTHKSTVLAHVRRNGYWKGYIAPSKVNRSNVNYGWHLGKEVLITVDRTGEMYYISQDGSKYGTYEKLTTMLNEFMYYNCNNELGKTVRFWSIYPKN